MTTESTVAPDWRELLRSWDRQQEGYVRNREQVITMMLDAVEAVAGDSPRVLDLGCGPGTISARVLERFPGARSVGVDFDPLLLAIGRGALGDGGGRLGWVEADLSTDDWPRSLGDERFDAVLSATALHWMTPQQLVTTYGNIASVLRPGGVFLNADRLDFDRRSPTCREISAKLTKQRWQSAFDGTGIDDWDSWWAGLAGHPTLDALLEKRRRNFSGDDRTTTQRPVTITSFALHAGALAEAGFQEIDTIWQDLNRRLLLAVR